jgi:hypothetical protein
MSRMTACTGDKAAQSSGCASCARPRETGRAGRDTLTPATRPAELACSHARQRQPVCTGAARRHGLYNLGGTIVPDALLRPPGRGVRGRRLGSTRSAGCWFSTMASAAWSRSRVTWPLLVVHSGRPALDWPRRPQQGRRRWLPTREARRTDSNPTRPFLTMAFPRQGRNAGQRVSLREPYRQPPLCHQPSAHKSPTPASGVCVRCESFQRAGRSSRLLVGCASAAKRRVSWTSTTAWTRSRRLSFWRMCVMCVLTVASLM